MVSISAEVMVLSDRLTTSQAQMLADFLRKYIFQGIVEPLHLELTAHLVALEALKHTHPEVVQIIDAALNVARTSPVLQDLMHQKYHVALEKHLRQFVERVQDVESLEQMFRDLKQTSVN